MLLTGLSLTVGCSFTLVFLSYSTTGEFCFRKIHGPDSEEPGSTICRGLIDHENFPTARSCCDGKGVAFYAKLVVYGRRGKKYKCIPCGSSSELVNDLIVDKKTGWSDWGQWSECSKTCQIGIRSRQRICYGEEVDGKCTGDNKEMEQCTLAAYCPVDGNWGPWQSWSSCDRTCGGGARIRMRSCNDPPPQHGGQVCSGSASDAEECNTLGCPVDGGWSDWTMSSECSVTCGKGKTSRTRECNNPTPRNGGNYCLGVDSVKEKCELEKCPVDGGWALWSTWSSCEVTCGEGQRLRTRTCDAPSPRHGGSNCTGEPNELQVCHSLYPCPVDGNWSAWGEWSPCLARPCSGDKGLRKRTRTCSDPQPRYRGKFCEGDHTETSECLNDYLCPVNGEWCQWTAYDDCRVSDSGPFIRRTRGCLCPSPTNGGMNCVGEDFQVDRCGLRKFNQGDEEVVSNGKKKCDREEGSGYLYGDEDDEDC